MNNIRTYGQALGQGTVRQDEADRCRACQRAQYRHNGQKYQPGIERTEILQCLRVVTYTQSYTEHQGAKCIEADLAIHDCINGYQVENSAKRTQNKETDYDKAAFHAVFPFFLYKAFHSAQAAMTLPNVLPKVSITASMPMVCNPLMICSLPPTSMPRMNSSAQINTVMTV